MYSRRKRDSETPGGLDGAEKLIAIRLPLSARPSAIFVSFWQLGGAALADIEDVYVQYVSTIRRAPAADLKSWPQLQELDWIFDRPTHRPTDHQVFRRRKVFKIRRIVPFFQHLGRHEEQIIHPPRTARRFIWGSLKASFSILEICVGCRWLSLRICRT